MKWKKANRSSRVYLDDQGRPQMNLSYDCILESPDEIATYQDSAFLEMSLINLLKESAAPYIRQPFGNQSIWTSTTNEIAILPQVFLPGLCVVGINIGTLMAYGIGSPGQMFYPCDVTYGLPNRVPLDSGWLELSANVSISTEPRAYDIYGAPIIAQYRPSSIDNDDTWNDPWTQRIFKHNMVMQTALPLQVRRFTTWMSYSKDMIGQTIDPANTQINSLLSQEGYGGYLERAVSTWANLVGTVNKEIVNPANAYNLLLNLPDNGEPNAGIQVTSAYGEVPVVPACSYMWTNLDISTPDCGMTYQVTVDFTKKPTGLSWEQVVLGTDEQGKYPAEVDISALFGADPAPPSGSPNADQRELNNEVDGVQLYGGCMPYLYARVDWSQAPIGINL